ncbi:hypothetical protein [Pseudanabaena yagii]|uniref:Uncharacterized protein n=1 Tax=Pseudanabaena yagii GIHE-NHR1 TaxID=2722753 RepID=A0ABX1LYP5_9CYAN|nr:hypothetical protein [Pseudanabaena yagii]NMF59844.1 hypothetical protein [Pseudanabaena yagii GIHE-NHR1]
MQFGANYPKIICCKIEIFSQSELFSLHDQLKLTALPDLRSKYEYEIVEQAQATGHKALKAAVVK